MAGATGVAKYGQQSSFFLAGGYQRFLGVNTNCKSGFRDSMLSTCGNDGFCTGRPFETHWL
jgi:hypothetical protein